MTDQNRTQVPDISELYRLSANVEPPPALDAAIKQLAHAPGSPQRKGRQWMLGLSLAATVLLAVGLVRQLVEQTPEILRPIPLEEERVGAPLGTSLPRDPADGEKTPAATSAMEVLPGAKSLAAPEPKKTETAAKESGRRSLVRERSVEPSTLGLEVPRSDASGNAVGRAATSVQHKRIGPSALSKQKSQQMRQESTDTREAPVTRSMDLTTTPSSRSFRIDALEDRDDAAPAMAPPAATQDAFTPYRMKQSGVAPTLEMDKADPKLGPDTWLQQIRDLMKAGRMEEARARLIELEAAYPAVALPQDLVQGLSR